MRTIANMVFGMGIAGVGMLLAPDAKASCGAWSEVEATTSNQTVNGSDVCCNPTSCSGTAHIEGISYGTSFGTNGEGGFNAVMNVYGYSAVNGNNGFYAELWGACSGSWVEGNLIGPLYSWSGGQLTSLNCPSMQASVAWVFLD